jgi:hypothetical protein
MEIFYTLFHPPTPFIFFPENPAVKLSLPSLESKFKKMNLNLLPVASNAV